MTRAGRAEGFFVRGVAYGLFALWACLVACTYPVGAQSLEAGTIIVTVTDAVTEKPIDNAQVFLLGGDTPQSSLTNLKGLLIFNLIQPGSYRVRVDADGYQQTNTAVEIYEGQRVHVNVALAPSAPLKTIASVLSKGSVVSVNVEEANAQSAQRRISQTLSDALNKLAGVSVDDQLYGAGSSFNVSLRGADASQTAYSIDGVRINGAAAQSLGGLQDLFSGASVNFAPSAGGGAGSINFFTLQPSKIWNYGFTGVIGNYARTLGTWWATGGFGKVAMAFEHSGGGQVGPLDGALYQDQTGSTYMHAGGFSRDADLFKASIALSPASTFKYSILGSTFNSSYICANATALLPCGSGPNNNQRSRSSYQNVAFGSLLGHVQYNLNASAGKFKSNDAEPNRAVNGTVIPFYSTSTFPWSNFGLQLSSTARRHTMSAGFFHGSQTGTTASTFNATQAVQSETTSRYGSMYFSDKVKANDRLTLTHGISQSSATGAGSALELYESVTWQPAIADVFEGDIGLGSASGFGTFTTPLGDPLSADYDCYNHSVFVQGPTDEPGNQSSISYNVGWRHTLKGGFVNVQLYRNRYVGQNVRAAVPISAEPSSIFPSGSLAAYMTGLQQTWAQPTICGTTPFDPSGVYVTQNMSGLTQFNQGFSITGQIPIGKSILAFPTYATTNTYYSTLDPRLLAPSSYYAVGFQVPHVPLHKAGLIIDGVVPHTPLEWLADAEFTSANNPQNLPAYTVYNAGLVVKLPRGSLSLLAANIFGTHTALFTTYQGVNPMPLQGGGTFAFATTPLPPRSLTIQYQVRWRQHYQPPQAAAPAASPKP
jgi:hypothetical protein